MERASLVKWQGGVCQFAKPLPTTSRGKESHNALPLNFALKFQPAKNAGHHYG